MSAPTPVVVPGTIQPTTITFDPDAGHSEVVQTGADPGVVVVPIAGPETTRIVYAAARGPKGDPGVQPEVYTFATPVGTWSIEHTLGRYPSSVQVVVNGSVMIADVSMPSENLVVITHAIPTAGRATLI